MWPINFVGLPGAQPAPAVTLQGLAADIPPASSDNEGWLYLATDTNGGTLYRSDGTAWTQAAGGVSGGGGNSFTTIAVSGQSDVVADSSTDTLTLAAGSNITITTNAGTDTITIAASSGSTNALLDGSNHTDTLAGTVVRGDIIVGNSTPKWSRLAAGALASVLIMSASDPYWGTLGIASGGTGLTTTTAYAVFCGGTTSTGAFQQVSGLGTSGQVLTSNGAGALPTWQASSAPAAASAAEQETGAEAAKYVAPATQHNHDSSTKFWIRFNGTTNAVGDSYNVTSLSDNGTGDHTVNIATDFSSTSWAPWHSGRRNATGSHGVTEVSSDAGDAAGTLTVEQVSFTPANVDFEMVAAGGSGDQ